MAEQKHLKEFDLAVRNLLKWGMKIHDATRRPRGEDKLYMIWTNKFLAAYSQVGDASKFKSMFHNFYKIWGKEIGKPIFVDRPDGNVEVNDKWLRSEELFPLPGESVVRVRGGDGWSPLSARCKGPVIYYNLKEKKTHSVSIPIGEIYRASMAIYKEKAKSDICCPYPMEIIRFLMLIYRHLLAEDHPDQKVLQANIQQLTEYLDQISITRSSSSSSSPGDSSGIKGISQIISRVMNSAGVGGDNFNDEAITTGLNQALQPEALDSVGKIIKTVMKAVGGEDGKQPQDIGEAVGKLGKVLQSDEVKTVFTQTAVQVGQATASLRASVPHLPDGDAPKQPEGPDVGEPSPDEQE